jgi:hypothetical protein
MTEFDPRSTRVGFVADKSTHAVFSPSTSHSLQILVLPNAPSGDGTVGTLAAGVPSGLSLTPPHELQTNNE